MLVFLLPRFPPFFFFLLLHFFLIFFPFPFQPFFREWRIPPAAIRRAYLFALAWIYLRRTNKWMFVKKWIAV